MSAAKAEPGAGKLDYRIREGGPWSGAWKLAAAIGVLGLAGAGAGFASDQYRFAFSYLFAFMSVLAVGLGALFFVLIQHLVAAHWSVTTRRTAEFFMSGLFVFALLFIPLGAVATHLYPWMHSQEHGAEHGAGHGAHGEHGAAHGEHGAAHGEHADHATGHEEHGSAHGEHGAAGRPGIDVWTTPRAAAPLDHAALEHHEHARIIRGKAPWLNPRGFYIRAVIYFALWIFLSMRFFNWSTEQDKTKDKNLTNKMQGIAPMSAAIFALSLTFAAIDWVMSMQPTWFSTIFGVCYFSCTAVAIFATLIVVTMSFRDNGLIGDAVNTEHYHDLGKLLFGFGVFWAYVNFSQFFLIWYAGIPEETPFYHHRWGNSPWMTVSVFIVVGKFALPFLFLISRNVKRRLGMLRLGAMWVLVMHVVEMYWLIFPMYGRNLPATDARHVAEYTPSVLNVHWIDIACLAGVAGVYLAVVFYRMAKHPLIPVGDPRLSRSLHHENH